MKKRRSDCAKLAFMEILGKHGKPFFRYSAKDIEAETVA